MTVEENIERIASRRVRLGLWIAANFALVLAAIAASDALVHAGAAKTPLHVAVIVGLVAAAALLVINLARFAVLTHRSMRDPQLRRLLWDELASSNHSQAMVFAYLAMLLVLFVLALISMVTALSAPWVINGLMVTAFGVQAISFGLLERRGTDRDA